jgi:hypothetical protein
MKWAGLAAAAWKKAIQNGNHSDNSNYEWDKLPYC